MTPLTLVRSRAVPLIRDNIDTDAIIPSREMKGTGKTGLADGLFAGWRYTAIDGRDPDPAFVLNDPALRGAQILLGGANFGCGSSREHAVWALAEYGFRVVIAPSFNPIFRGNCVRNGVAPIELDPRLLGQGEIVVDLPAQCVTSARGRFDFAIEAEAKAMLVGGLDGIALTLLRAEEIAAFRAADRAARGWAYL
jgi:3-isopropylmalate/(R)-2-methylmalate dehydratase small subunit